MRNGIMRSTAIISNFDERNLYPYSGGLDDGLGSSCPSPWLHPLNL